MKEKRKTPPLSESADGALPSVGAAACKPPTGCQDYIPHQLTAALVIWKAFNTSASFMTVTLGRS